MLRRVRIKKLPQAKTGFQVEGSLYNDVPAMGGGADYNAYIGKPNLKLSKYITAVPRDEANLEAEGGETVFGDINGDGFPEHKVIKGPRHSEGGVPLKLPEDTFIFSDTKSMKIKDPNILSMFNKSAKKSGYTPAELAKAYDIDRYRKILQDPDSDILDKKTAELMIRNYNVKLGKLALAQEAKKGFPQGIPKVAEPAMAALRLDAQKIIPKDLPSPMPPQGEMPEEEMESQEFQQGEAQGQEMAEQMNEGNPVAMPMAMYGMTMGGYDMPFDLPQAAYGMPLGITARNYEGRDFTMYSNGGAPYEPLLRMQTAGSVPKKSKTYTEKDLPEGTVVKDAKDMSVTTGDYVRKADGTIVKVTSANPQWNAVDTQTKKGSREEFMSKSPENKALMEKADKILEDAVERKQAVKVGDTIKLKGNLKLPFEERIMLSRALNASPEFGTGKYKIGTQSATEGYSKQKAGQWKGSGSFVAGFTPEDYEKRYLFEKARGHGLSDEEAFQKINETYSDKKKQAALRKEFLGYLGEKDLANKSDDELLSDSFYKTNYAKVTTGIENVHGQAGYRPKIGNEQLSGFEHFDAAGYNPNFQYEEEPENKPEPGEEPEKEKQPCECTKADGTKVPSYIDESTGECSELPCQEKAAPQDTPAPWWLQDTIKTTGAFGDLMSVKKYMPWAPRVDLETPRPTFLDPTRELAANAEQANIQTQGMAQFAGPQALSARASSVQGQSAKNAADILSKYNNANVNIANQFETQATNIRNQEQTMNQGAAQRLYDQNTIANQQYDNAKMALKNNLRNQYTNAITNRWQTNALNQMYPQFNVDPSVGGRGFYTGVGKKITPGSGGTSWQQAYDQCKKNNPDMSDELLKECAKNSVSAGAANNDQAAYNAHYGGKKKEGGESNHGYVYGDITYPFIL
jgi:hypothetical protein